MELRRVADRFAIKRVFCAVDPGLVVNPNTLEAQIQGGIGFALTNTLKSKITFSNGGADQSNFFDYPLLRIDEMPEIVPIVLASDRPPQGFGEVVLAPVAPALAQALLHATGRRLDVMPFPEDAFRVAAGGTGDPARPAAARPAPRTPKKAAVIMRKTGQSGRTPRAGTHRP